MDVVKLACTVGWGLGFKAAAKLDMHQAPKSDLTSALQTDKPNIRLHVIDKDEKISLRFIQHAGLVPRQEAPQSVVDPGILSFI